MHVAFGERGGTCSLVVAESAAVVVGNRAIANDKLGHVIAAGEEEGDRVQLAERVLGDRGVEDAMVSTPMTRSAPLPWNTCSMERSFRPCAGGEDFRVQDDGLDTLARLPPARL